MKLFTFMLCMTAAATAVLGQSRAQFFYEGASQPMVSAFQTCEPFFDQYHRPLQSIWSLDPANCFYYQDKQCQMMIRMPPTYLPRGARTFIRRSQPSPGGIKCTLIMDERYESNIAKG
ncbi:hypothetical protein BCR42DRAFT_497019 [Absidia repens]|uniref:Uncharacterized protein n=1 Tax=Absidia repens TaxID=90262 RepID=A0A1X2HXE9_9FUNG|nr:hypothetical protein BCR42DRAFT_497019 [Absidia repens]